MKQQRIFSGIQPSGEIHIGNYVGAIQNWVALQDQYDCIFCIVDYHAITVPYDASALSKRTLEAVASNLAAGLDPDRSTIFVQSHVPAHAELEWLLNCITPLGFLERMTQFKEKSRSGERESVHTGLLTYPVLQAADILIYKAHAVPVGDDQLQHIEFARDIARKFNHLFGETFPEPRALLSQAPRVMSLSDPERKMSKSEPGGCVSLSDDSETIRRKVMRAVTDAGPTPDGEMSAGVRNLMSLLRSFAGDDAADSFEKAHAEGSLRYKDLKEALAEAVIETLAPIRERMQELLARPDELRQIVGDGAAKLRPMAAQTLDEVKEKMGFYR